MDASDLSVTMQKWGIPEKEMVSAENTLLERLVWVPYKGHWWPAILYQSYTELQTHIYCELDMVLKAQFAVAIMRQMNDPRQIKVARLLGREILEVVEVDDKHYAEFYGQLPKVLPMACRKSRYGDDLVLYLDFHRALDQVEEIIRDISKNSFNLIQSVEKKTWLQRAQEALKSTEVSTSVPTSVPKPSWVSFTGSDSSSNNIKAAVDQEESNFLFSALDNVMDGLNNTYDCVSGEGSEAAVDRQVVVENKTKMNAHSQAILKQKEMRDALRKVLASQRQIRESGSSSTNNAIAVDEARNPSSDGNGKLKRSASTEVLPGLDAEDIVPGITDTSMWKLLNLNDKDEHAAPLPVPSQSFNKVVQTRLYTDELTNTLPQKSKGAVGQTARDTTYRPQPKAVEAREEIPEDDREALMAAARAAAAVELEISFWDHMTCHTIDS